MAHCLLEHPEGIDERLSDVLDRRQRMHETLPAELRALEETIHAETAEVDAIRRLQTIPRWARGAARAAQAARRRAGAPQGLWAAASRAQGPGREGCGASSRAASEEGDRDHHREHRGAREGEGEGSLPPGPASFGLFRADLPGHGAAETVAQRRGRLDADSAVSMSRLRARKAATQTAQLGRCPSSMVLVSSDTTPKW